MSVTLEPFGARTYTNLEWTQPRRTRREYELRGDEHLVGTLVLRTSFGTLATAKVGDACWTFKRVGFFQQRVHVRACGADETLAEFVNATWAGGGTLRLGGGRTFRMTSNWWNTKWQVEDEDGRVLVHFDYGGAFRLSARVKIADEARALPDLPLLIALSWYLVVMLAEDAAASAVIIG